MVPPPQGPAKRTSLSGPALVRILARFGETEVLASEQPLADRLSQWLGWTDAIALSTVLSAPAASMAAAAGARTNGADEAQRGLELRSALSKAIACDALLAPAKRALRGAALAQARAQVPETPEMAADFALYRQCYLALQQKMESDIGDLRTRLRSRLAVQSAPMAKLATLDAAMERSLAARERSLLGTVPGLLGAHFERLRKAAKAAQAELEAQADATKQAEAPTQAPTAAPAATPAADTPAGAAAQSPADRGAPGPQAWLDTFRKDMQSVLLAELDVRFQPVEGLIAALRAR
ncbi:DUF3348 domain-containing protein [Paraburkholderia tropica]|uniref:DUF3348 domain-containing protein n=1 Tax=Paraburkholderia tropica TaxID=92647 RepID=UPI0015FFB738|nr:DUF3348 domain-containing protein [Paraburkholderia tropica]MBB3002653.1 hypothetical protein [Paraburkholderia tropica]MBB6321990.1 hypothetical protein [Paraburkholderia tropica]QNB16315.1 DUF3348 domain-containing protein [Paraburkholderia tropica]